MLRLDGVARGAENLTVEPAENIPLVMLVDGTNEADSIAEAIQEVGVRLVRAADTITAESLFVSVLPNLIVLSLDDEGASAFCDLISAIPRGSGVPVMLVGGADEALRAPIEATLRGPHTFVPRPVQRPLLLDELQTLLHAESSEATRLSPPPLSPPPTMGILEENGADFAPPPVDGLEMALAGSFREPTQVLDEPASPVDLFLRSELDASLAEPLEQGSINLGLADEPLPGPLPWEISLETPLVPDLDDELSVSTDERIDTRLNTIDRPRYSEALTMDEHPDPWSTVAGEVAHRQERTQEHPGDQGSQNALDDDLHNDGVTELSADFRRVIDEVAQRLFPESSPDEYQDEDIDEIKTVVPEVERRADYDEERGGGYDDELEEYSIEAMETFTVGSAGLTLSVLEGPPTEDRNLVEGDAVDTGQVLTAKRSAIHERSPVEQQTVDDDAETGERTKDGELLSKTRPREPHIEESRSTLFLLMGRSRVSYGDLDEHSFPTLFAACVSSRFDGQLVLRNQQAGSKNASVGTTELSLPLRTVVFDQGRPVVASSGLVHDRLVSHLHRQGRLTDQGYERCRAMISETGRRPGAILVELGVIKSQELFPQVRWHYQEVLYSCFDWRRGTFWVEPRPDLTQWRIQLEQSGEELLLEGLRRRYTATELEGHLGGGGVRLQRNVPVEALPGYGVLEQEQLLLRLCDGVRPVSRILEEIDIDRGQALAVLYGLTLLGALALGPHQQSRQMSSSPSTEHDVAVDRARLEQRIRLCREADYFTLLGVSTEASAYEVRKAYDAVSKELSSGYLAAIDATDLDGQLGDVRYVIDEALEVLTDDSLREAYRLNRFALTRQVSTREGDDAANLSRTRTS